MRIIYATAIAAVCCLAVDATAQNPLLQPGFVAGGPAAVQGTADATQMTGPVGKSDSFVNAYGEPFVMPAAHYAPAGGGGPMGGCAPTDGGYGANYGDAGGYPNNGAFGAGWMNTEQCGPHYFDFGVEYLFYSRDESAFGDTPIATEGFANEDLGGLEEQVRLSTGDLDTNDLNGYRLTGRIDVGALSVFEVAYSGLFSDEVSNSFSVPQSESTARLFSVFSRFGTRTNGGPGSTPGRPFDTDNPPASIPEPVGGFPAANDNPGGTNYQETDFASYQEISAESELHNAEALFRRYWVGYNPRVSGTVLLGFRYTSLEDRISYRSIGSQQIGTGTPAVFGPDPGLDISISSGAENRLAGFEFGGDAWVTMLQGLRVGSEIKVGIYNNDYEVTSAVSAVDGSPNKQVTAFDDDQVSFLTEFKLMAVADLTPSWSVKAGYELLYISDVALAGDGLTFARPYGQTNGTMGTLPRADGEAYYNGFHVGAEYVW